jgi:hypothetical protein
MPLPRNYIDGIDNAGMGFALGQPRFVPDAGRVFKAVDLSCGGCGAPVGSPCTGKTVCAQRMADLRTAIDNGTASSHGPVRPEQVCPDCAKERRNGRPLGCKPAHTCVKIISGNKCTYAKETSLDVCSYHAGHWGSITPDSAPTKKKSGRSKLSPTQVQQIIQKYRDGATLYALGQEFGVSPASVRYHLDKADGQ